MSLAILSAKDDLNEVSSLPCDIGRQNTKSYIKARDTTPTSMK